MKRYYCFSEVAGWTRFTLVILVAFAAGAVDVWSRRMNFGNLLRMTLLRMCLTLSTPTAAADAETWMKSCQKK